MVTQVLVLVALFQVKHLVADFLLQSQYIIQNRRIYGHPAGILHVAYHLAASAICLWLVGCDIPTALTLLIAEALIHYHVDWAKDNIVTAKSLTPTDNAFWHLLGFDQLLHHLTYLGMTAYFALRLTAG